MSVHKSLKLQNALVRHRNVFTRAERIEILKARGVWKDGDKIRGLQKTRTDKA